MVEFKTPEIGDLAWAREALRSEGPVGSEYGFGTIFLWCHAYGTRIARYKDSLLIRYSGETRYAYCMPFDRFPAEELIEIAQADAGRDGKEITLSGFSKEKMEEIKAQKPDMLSFFPLDDLYDYIYSTEDLAFLKGRKYHGKRNHLARFRKLYPDSTFHVLKKDDAEAVHQVLSRWMSESESPEEYHMEVEAIEKAMRFYDELDLCGGYITVGGVPAAFVIGERLNADTVDLHFEKALKAYDGLYAAINQEMANYLVGKCVYINREEDLGLEGLRQAKSSYHPVLLLEKYGAELLRRP